MQRKDLALRVLSTAAIMSIVTSIAAPAFAGTYYIGKGSIDVEATTDADGKQYVKVTQGDKTYTDTSNEIVIKDGNDESDTTLKDADRAAATPAVAPAATPATQELEAAGSADAAGESQSDPDDAFTLNETEEDSAQTSEGNNPTEDTPDPSTEPPKKDVVYEYAPADPEPEQQATKPTLSTSADPTAETREATQANAPAADPPAEGSVKNPTTNVINVVNNWVGKAAKELKIRLSNVNIKVGNSVDKAAMDVSGGGKTKIELDGQNALDSSATSYQAGLRKQGEGTLTITDETDDTGNQITAPKSGDSGSLTAKGGGSNDAAGIGKAIGGAGIGGKIGESTKNIIIEGYATVDAAGGGRGAGIGGGGGTADHGSGSVSGDAENIIIQGHSKVTATAQNGAAIGGGSTLWSKNGCYVGGSAKGIVIRDHATVVAKGSGISGFTGYGAAIGAAGGSGNNTEAEVTIGTPGATVEQEDVHVTATGLYGSAIGNGAKDTKVTIQGHVTIQTASSQIFVAIGSMKGNVEVNINDNVAIDTDDAAINVDPDRAGSTIGGGHNESGRTVIVNIDGRDDGRIEIGAKSALTGFGGIISGTEVNIGDNVLLKMKLLKYVDSKYINVNNAEAEVGKRSNPTAGGLVNTIGDNTQLWYTDFNGVLQKIVHSKNLCKKELVGETAATCTTPGSKTYKCTFESFESNNSAVDPEHTEQWTENTAIDPNAHDWGEWQVTTRATCTTKGVETRYCNRDHSHVETRTTPALGHHWKDNGDGTHTCPDCGATEGQPVNTNSALELRVVDAEGMNQPFTVSQNGTLRTYTGAYDTATLTGDLNTLRYLQEHGAQTIQFVTNGQTSSFAINDLLAQGSGSEVFYLTHRGAEEPTLLLVEADHSDLVKD
jgi:hypothetical protein